MTPTVGDQPTERQPSPPTRRAVAVLAAVVDASTTRPDRHSTLADIVRDTGMSRATAHAIVAELVGLGWLNRDDAGTITLGPDFLATAARALDGDRLSTSARPVLAALSSDLGMPVFLARRIDDDTITVVEYAPDRTDAPHLQIGRPITLRPPICREFLAWEPADVQQRWLGRARPEDRDRLRRVLTAVADRGYSVERITDEHRAVMDSLAEMSSVPASLRSRVGALVSELAAIDYLPAELVGEVGAVTVGAPVFDGDRVVASVVACPNATMSADDLDRVGRAAVASAALLGSGR
ncbi:MAG: helix-turn-helix domain-containing protein [Gordonia sp. (in: high G+C Gram-positive bacteria)]|uniref:IclR family transcriptional regulator n=1 Tax=Gordonia sp. (in: high G+C Gram-positive bacteria) TaxID=84139 RepID=UPI0039E5C35C